MADERYRDAFGSSSAGSTYAVYIIFRHMGQIKINHIRQFLYINTACGDIGGNQHLQCASFEFRQRFGACALAFVAMDRHALNVLCVEFFGELVGTVFGARKHQYLKPTSFFNEAT